MKKKLRILLVRANYLPGPIGRLLAPPIGLLTLASVLRKERPDRTEVRVVDTGVNRLRPEDVAPIVRSWEPDVMGISAFSSEAGVMHGLALMAKQVSPGIKVVAGGAHSTTFYDLLLQDKNIDYAVVGEGEITFVELLDRIAEGEEPEGIPGLAYAKEGEIFFGGHRPFIEDLDSIPIPAWDLVKLGPYTWRAISMNGFLAGIPYANLFTSRACPFNCVYCHGNFGKKFRAQSAERVVEEVELLSTRFGVKECQVHDDVFNFDRKRVIDIMDGVLSRDIKMKFCFPNAVRGDLMTKDVVKALARGGTYSVIYAVETASPRLQKLIRKNLNLDKVRDAIEWSFDEGIIPSGYHMIGFPTETREEIEMTLDFAFNSKMLKAAFFAVTPFPRTPLFDIVKKTYPNFEFRYDFSTGLHYFSKEPYFTKVAGIDIVEIQKRAWKKFYLNPWRIYNIFKMAPINRAFILNTLFSVASSFLAIARPDVPTRNYFSHLPGSIYDCEKLG